MRPGQGHSSSPRPPSNSTVTDNHVRAIPRGWHAAPDTTAGPTRCSVAVSGPLPVTPSSLDRRPSNTAAAHDPFTYAWASAGLSLSLAAPSSLLAAASIRDPRPSSLSSIHQVDSPPRPILQKTGLGASRPRQL